MELTAQHIAITDAASATQVVTEVVREVCCGRFGSALRALVMTGSMARGEATVVPAGRAARLLGDADLFLVFHAGVAIPGDDVRNAEQAVERALAQRNLAAKIGLAPVHPNIFAGMPRHIATYELRECGRVIWGDEKILSLVPQFSAAEISREDAWRMLANRMIEQLEAAAQDGIQSPRSQYATAKLFLDMATSFLIGVGRYQPTYAGRLRALREAAAAQIADTPFPLPPFVDLVSAATAFKLQGQELPYAPEKWWTDAVHYAEGLWVWHLNHLVGGPADRDGGELMKKWMRGVPWKARFRGWLSAARRSPRGARAAWLKLAVKGSPRYLTYGVAAELFFQLAEAPSRDLGRQDWSRLAADLPLSQALPQVPSAPCPWPILAQHIAFNYHSLLESTTT